MTEGKEKRLSALNLPWTGLPLYLALSNTSSILRSVSTIASPPLQCRLLCDFVFLTEDDARLHHSESKGRGLRELPCHSLHPTCPHPQPCPSSPVVRVAEMIQGQSHERKVEMKSHPPETAEAFGGPVELRHRYPIPNVTSSCLQSSLVLPYIHVDVTAEPHLYS